jgi:hypothetical protein
MNYSEYSQLFVRIIACSIHVNQIKRHPDQECLSNEMVGWLLKLISIVFDQPVSYPSTGFFYIYPCNTGEFFDSSVEFF